MQKYRKKRQEVAGRVDFGRPKTFASGVVRTLLPSWSRRASLSPVAVAGLACLPALGIPVGIGCQPAPHATTPSTTHFEIPFARKPEASAEPNPRRDGAASAALPAPVLPRNLPAGFARQQSCDGDCSLAGWLPDPSYADSPFEELPAQAAIWVHVLGPRAKLRLPPNPALELVVVCLKGELGARDTISTAEGTAEPVRLSPWTALRASGAGTELECALGDCHVMLALIAPNSTLAAAVRAKSTAAPRQAAFEVRAFQDATTAVSNHGKYHARVLFGGGATTPPMPFSLTLLQAAAPALITPHTHETSWENLLVLEGRGDLELRGRSYPIQGGESLHIGPRVRHAYVARGQERFVALQLYTPAGPERRFLATPGADSTSSDADAGAHRVPP